MLVLLRILSTGAFVYAVAYTRKLDVTHGGQSGDLNFAMHLALCVFLGLFVAVTWAPYLGACVSRPLTGTITEGTVIDVRDRVLQIIRWLEARRFRRMALFFCFLEGIRRPWLPSAFVIGLRNAREGSWLEKVYAREVFRFDNTEHCIAAREALRRHGIEPGLHRRQEINAVLMSLDRRQKDTAEVLKVPPAPPPPEVKRNRRIRLFDQPEEPETGG